MSPERLRNLVNIYLRRKGLPTDIDVTFPDVHIVSEKSRVRRRSEIRDFSTFLAKDIKLGIPIVSANMPDVTESGMAIALARLGGCGFIHQMGPPEKRISEVMKVKRADNAIVENPWVVNQNDKLTDALQFMKAKKTSGVLVVDEHGLLAGILTNRDVRFLDRIHSSGVSGLSVRDVMRKMPLVTGGADITIEEAIKLLHANSIEKLPLLDREGKPVGLITAKDILKRDQFPRASRDKKGRLRVGAAVRLNEDYLKVGAQLIQAGADALLLDAPNANTDAVKETVHELRKAFPKHPLIAGNVDDARGALMLAEAGADAVKVGIGPGSACETRMATGRGKPQLSAIAGCAAVGKEHNVRIIADGGIRGGDDLAKALVAGADSVMLGSLFAPTEESPGEIFQDTSGEPYKIYRGSASLDAQVQRLYAGDLDSIRAPEGGTRKLPFKGQKVSDVIEVLLGDLRSSMAFGNAFTIDELRGNVFRRQTAAGYREGQPRV